mgnify:CR=1 FL=1
MSYALPADLKAAQIVSARRLLLMGPPNTFKTSAVVQTWPRPLHVLVYPGEKGDATIPRNVEGVHPYVWTDDPVSKTSSSLIVAQVEALTWKILGGEYGEITSFCGDGIHKYYDFILDSITGGAFFKGEEFEPRLYGRAHEHFKYYVNRINSSPVPYASFTCWDGREMDEAGQKAGPSHIYPDLPGKMAKRIMGEFSVVIYSIADYAMRQPNKPVPAYWQLLPEGKVWGAAVKAPYEVVMKLPTKIPQSLVVLEDTLAKAYAQCAPSSAPSA